MLPAPADPLDLASALLGARDLEEAAGRLLADLLQSADTLLRPRAPDLRLLGALLYLRAGDLPRGVVARAGEDPAHRPSLSTWQRVRASGRALLLDVLAGGVELAGATVAEVPASGALSQTWRGGRATHLIAWPLRAPALGLAGMVTLELQTESDNDLLLPGLLTLRRHGQGLVDVSAAALILLPRPAAREPLPQDGLPVIGPELEPVLRELMAFAALDDAVLLLRGESGTGKTTLARWAHARSPRAGGPFVVARLHERPETLHHGALFGWARGAFTDARQEQAGLLEQAAGGTLFIDEIDKLSREAQGALLGVLDGGAFSRLGESRERRADLRVFVGTNADLEGAVRQGRFLEDLYYRINVLTVTLPPLRERRGEIGPVAEAVLAGLAPGGGALLAEEARALLVAQPWPGNLRELKSAVTRAYAFALAGRGAGPVVVEERHVARALAQGRPEEGALEAMQRAATAFLDELERRREAGAPLSLEHADALRGLVLREAVRRHGLNAAYALVGQEQAVEQNNQHKLYQRQLARVEALERVLRGR